MASVMIGIDPHKGSHTAFVIDGREKQLGRLRVRASSKQAEALLDWAGRWRQRTWAIEGARGLGNLLAQQLIAAGERVLEVPPKLAARVRLLDSGQINKTDENDARSVAVAALRARALPELSVEDQTIVMRIWARRYHDLARLRTQAVCRLHTVLCELVPGGVHKQLRTSQAVAIVEGIVAQSPVAQAKLELARDLVADLQRIDAQRREVKRRVARAVAAANTSITDVYGVGPIVAACVLGYVRDIRRFPSRDRFASYNGTAPIEVSSGDRRIYRLSRRGNRQLNHAVHVAAVSQISHRGSEGYAYYQRKRVEGMTGKCALRRSNARSATPSTSGCSPTPDAPHRDQTTAAREGKRGTTLHPARPDHTPNRLFGKATPGPRPTLRPQAPTNRAPHPPRPVDGPLDTKRPRSARGRISRC